MKKRYKYNKKKGRKMFKINDDVKTFVQNEKGNLKPVVILNLINDTITQMLAYNLPKSYVLSFINRELGTDINYQTFNSYLKKQKRIPKRPAAKQTTQTGADGFLSKLRGNDTSTDSPAEKSGVPKIVGII